MNFLIIAMSFFSVFLFSEIDITITGAKIRKPKIAVGQIVSDIPNPNDAFYAKRLKTELISDLELLNIFEFLPENLFIQLDKPKDTTEPNYDEWVSRQVNFYLRMTYRLVSNNLVLDATFFDIGSRKKIIAKRYQYAALQPHKVTHAVAEDIFEKMTGERGLFSSRVLMVCQTPGKKRNSPLSKEIFIMDSDGRNLKQLTNDYTISVSPSWSPDGKVITYTQFEWLIQGKKRLKGHVIKKHDLITGKRDYLSSKEGMNSGASWSSDGKKIAATLSFSGRPEVYLLDPNILNTEPEPFSRLISWQKIGGGLQKNDPKLLFEVEPSWSPDGKYMVLSSARSKHPMIYVVELATKLAKQLTFAGTYNSSPSWSPKGDRIIFAAQRLEEGNFDLFIIDKDGNNLQRLTVGDRVGKRSVNSKNPSWSPTGTHFVFGNNDGGDSAIYLMTIDGAIKRKISPIGKVCSNPAWGPKE